MKGKIVLLSAVLALAGVACGGSDDGGALTGPTAGETASDTPTTTGPKVSVADDVFNPNSITAKVGDTVTWTWTGTNPHTVSGEGVESGIKNKGATFTHTFTEAGTFAYLCKVHPAMKGTVEVTA